MPDRSTSHELSIPETPLGKALAFLVGVRGTDPEGYRCRIGALWTRIFLPRGWALVAFQTVWIRDAKTWRRYLEDEFWRAHEHHHFWQERSRFSNTFTYLAAFVWQYVRHRGHANAPLEKEADEAARRELEARRSARE